VKNKATFSMQGGRGKIHEPQGVSNLLTVPTKRKEKNNPLFQGKKEFANPLIRGGGGGEGGFSRSSALKEKKPTTKSVLPGKGGKEEGKNSVCQGKGEKKERSENYRAVQRLDWAEKGDQIPASGGGKKRKKPNSAVKERKCSVKKSSFGVDEMGFSKENRCERGKRKKKKKKSKATRPAHGAAKRGGGGKKRNRCWA